MRIILTRDTFTPSYTLGEITLYGVPGIADGSGEIWTCEDTDRGLDVARPETWARKVKHETAIAVGTYPVTVTLSQRFGRRLPILGGVPVYEGVRLHAGNSSAHSSGCPIVGASRSVERGLVFRSRPMEQWLTERIEAALEQVVIEVKREPAAWARYVAQHPEVA